MAKKKFDIKSTIAVQPKTFSVDDIESAVKKIHAAQAKVDAPKEKKPAERPAKAETTSAPSAPKERAKPKPRTSEAPAPARRRGRPKSPEAPVRKVRLSVDVLPATHKALKIKAIQNDTDLMHYVEMLIEKDLAKG